MKLGLKRGPKGHRVKGDKNMTVVLIADPTKSGITLKVPKWVRFPMLIIPVLLLLAGMQVYSYIVDLESRLVAEQAEAQSNVYEILIKDQTIAELEAMDVQRYEQLEALGTLTEDLQEQLATLEAYKRVIDDKLETAEMTPQIAQDEEPNWRTSTGSSEDLESDEDDQPLEVVTDAPLAVEDKVVAGYQNLTTFLAIESMLQSEQPTASRDDFDGVAERLFSQVSDAGQTIEDELDIYETIDEQVDEMMPYWEAYPGVMPVSNTYVTSPYGYRRNPLGSGYEFHKGVDFKARYQDVWATGAGTVTYAGYNSGYGYMIIIDHGYGILTKYAHNSKLLVEAGDQVSRYDVIAISGNSGRSSGPHLHYEIIENGENQDPMTYIN